MKLLFISNLGGKKIGNFSVSSIEASKANNIEFHIAANWSQAEKKLLLQEEKKHSIKIHHIDLDRNPFSKQNITAYKQMVELIEKEKFDVIHCNTPIGGVLGRLCGKKAGVPKVIYTAHGFHFYKGASFINRTVFKWTEMWMAKYTDAIITMNEEDYLAAQKFKLRNDGKVYYVPGVGVESSFIKDAKPKRKEILNEIEAEDDSILIISVGDLNKNKNNEVIIKALEMIKNPKIHYLICGVGEKKEELLSLAKEFNIEKNIHFLGYRTDVPQLLKSSNIFVMPSYREGLSRSLMEAMSAGLPCIASKVRGNVDLIQEGVGGFLRDPDDSEGFAEAINRLALDKALREKMKASNLKKIKKFDVENVKKEMKKIYESELR